MSNKTEIKDTAEAKDRLEKLFKSEKKTNPPLNIKPDKKEKNKI